MRLVITQAYLFFWDLELPTHLCFAGKCMLWVRVRQWGVVSPKPKQRKMSQSVQETRNMITPMACPPLFFEPGRGRLSWGSKKARDVWVESLYAKKKPIPDQTKRNADRKAEIPP